MWHKFLLESARRFLSRRVRRRPPRPLEEFEASKVERVLLISATGLGDTLFSTPAIRAFKENFPHWRLDILAHRRFAPLLAGNPHIDRLWAYPGRNWRFLRLARELRCRNYGLAVILHGNDPEATLTAHLTGSPFIIGSARSPLAFAYAGRTEASHPLEHLIERRLNALRLLGGDTQDKTMELFLPPEAEETAAAILARHFGGPPGVLMAFHPFASWPNRCWPAASFASLGNLLSETYGASLLILSGAQDRAAAEALATRIEAPSLVTGGRYALPLVAALLRRCRLLVANDSGLLHMGLALKVPTIALLGPDHPRRIGPYQVDFGTYLCKRDEVCSEEPCLAKRCPDNRCLQAIPVGEVAETIKTWWEPRSAS